MPRQARVAVADVVYHVINRANGRLPIFHQDKDYQHFESLLQEAKDLTDMRILSYCIMPNHWHLILYPQTDTVLGEFMSWLTSTHVRQYRTKTETIGYGHLYQDRYKSFPVETNEYCQTLIRYVEQNPLRAKLVSRAEDWQWSSLWRRERGSDAQKKLLAPLPVELSDNYLSSVNEVLGEEILGELRNSVNKGKPFGKDEWVSRMVDEFDLEHTLRGAGRPKKN
jgi:putative transposase